MFTFHFSEGIHRIKEVKTAQDIPLEAKVGDKFIFTVVTEIRRYKCTDDARMIIYEFTLNLDIS